MAELITLRQAIEASPYLTLLDPPEDWDDENTFPPEPATTILLDLLDQDLKESVLACTNQAWIVDTMRLYVTLFGSQDCPADLGDRLPQVILGRLHDRLYGYFSEVSDVLDNLLDDLLPPSLDFLRPHLDSTAIFWDVLAQGFIVHKVLPYDPETDGPYYDGPVVLFHL